MTLDSRLAISHNAQSTHVSGNPFGVKTRICLVFFLCFNLLAPISNILIAYLWVLLEILLLILIFVKKPRYTFPSALCMIGSSLEYSSFVFPGAADNQLISIVTVLKPVGTAIFLLLAFVVSTTNSSTIKIQKFQSSSSTNWFYIVLISLILAPLVTVVQIIFNVYPNHLLAHPYHLATILFSQYFPVFIFVLCWIYTSSDRRNIHILAQSIYLTSISIGISGLIINILGFHGWYGDSAYYLSPLWQFMLPFFILFEPLTSLRSDKRFLLVWFTGCTVLPIFLLSLHGGKFLLFPLLALALLVSLYFNKKILYRSILQPFPIAVVIIALVLIAFFLQREALLLDSKLKESLSLFLFLFNFDIVWLEPSSGFRAAEFLNTYIHYLKNPLYILSGFGSLGWIYDYLNLFPYDLIGGFPDLESQVGIFASLHEISSLILRHGLLALVMLLGASILILDSDIRRTNPFLVIGLIWFIFFWGYSLSLPALGAPALCIGLSTKKSS